VNDHAAVLRLISALLHNSMRILIAAHIHPDGDAIGSLLGLGLTLQAAGKQVQMVSTDGVPSVYKFLVGADQVITFPSGNFDAMVTLDCSDIKRVGNALDEYALPDLNIDHHLTNENFAKINLVDVKAVATSEILAVILPQMGFKVTKPAAAALLTGIVTDTLGFRTSNMTSNALRSAADLFEFGVDLSEIYQKTLMEHSFEAIGYWAAGLNRLQRRDGLVWATLTLEDRKTAHYPGRDDADLITVLSSIADIDIAIIFVEQSHERVKVSWRARPGYDVSQIALGFGGGGHAAAAGAEIHGALAEVQERVLRATQLIRAGIVLENG